MLFRRILIEGGGDPEDPATTPLEGVLLEFGRALARTPSRIPAELRRRVEDRILDEYVRLLLISSTATGRRATSVSADPRAQLSDRLDGRVAFVTGAAHGQGRAIALALARQGADVAALDVAAKIDYPAYGQGSSDELDGLVAQVRALGRSAIALTGDVRDVAAVERAVEATVQRLGGLDIVVTTPASSPRRRMSRNSSRSSSPTGPATRRARRSSSMPAY